MIETEQSQKNDIGAISAIGQVTAIIAPLLYLLGRKYASAYFETLGCGWIFSHLTIQESIFYSLPITVPILAAIFLSLEALLNGITHKTLRKILIYFSLALFAIITACSFFWDFNYINTLAMAFSYSIFISFGIFISHTFLELRRRGIPHVQSAIAWIMGSTVVIYGSAATMGSIDATRSLDSPENSFPLITKGPESGRYLGMRLVSKVGDKYLLMYYVNGDKKFRIESNLDGYTIQPLNSTH